MSTTAQAMVYRRIHIVGGPGSGKTSLARRLTVPLNIPFHELDKVAFEGLDFVDRPLDKRLADVAQIAEQPAWITEGIFLHWIDLLLERADVIVWLDCVSWPTAASRIVFRFGQNGLSEVRRQPGARKFNRFGDYNRNLRQILRVLYTSRQYYYGRSSAPAMGESKAATAAALRPHWSKVVHCRSATDVEAFVARATAGAALGLRVVVPQMTSSEG